MRRPHYLARDPVWALPLVALVANLALVVIVLMQVHTPKSNLRVSVADPSRSVPASWQAPVLQVAGNGGLTLDGSPLVTPLDLEFRLEALADRGPALILRTAAKTDAAAMAKLLQTISQAGFSDVLVEVEQDGGGASPSVPRKPL